MEWLIIVFILMFVIAPVMWLKPSPRQKRQMALRSCAARQGVAVKMAKPPLHHFRGTMPAYRWHYPQQAPGPDFVLVRDSNASDALEPFHAGCAAASLARCGQHTLTNSVRASAPGCVGIGI